MIDLFYPQLASGAIAHYPIRKSSSTRTVTNVLPGGSIVLYPDDAARRTTWSWDYVGITLDEAALLRSFFQACDGPLRPFTFLDPAGNLLSAGSNIRDPAWQLSSALALSDLPGPIAGAGAFTVVNQSQAIQEIKQTLNIPSSYAYCFSLYARSVTQQSMTLFRSSLHSEELVPFEIGPDWKRVWSAGSLQDQTSGLSVGLRIHAGQQVSLSAAQLQAQPSLSPYRIGLQTGSIYTNAHWAIEELNIQYLGPNSCAVSVAIEASV